MDSGGVVVVMVNNNILLVCCYFVTYSQWQVLWIMEVVIMVNDSILPVTFCYRSSLVDTIGGCVLMAYYLVKTKVF